MKNFYSLALVGAMTILPSLVQASWQITYDQQTQWYKTYPYKISPGNWGMRTESGDVFTGAGHSVKVGSQPYPQNSGSFYQEVISEGTQHVRVTWVGPDPEPAYVRIILTTYATAEYNGARFPATLGVTDGFGGGGTQNYWFDSGSNTYSGFASASYVEDLDHMETHGLPMVFDANVYMHTISHAQLRYSNPGDYSGENGIDVGVSRSISVQAISE